MQAQIALLFSIFTIATVISGETEIPTSTTTVVPKESETNVTTETPTPPPAEIVSPIDENKELFINRVHAIASNISRNLVIQDTKVVWSPFVTVNAVVHLLRNDTMLSNGFHSANTYLREENPLNATIISVGYTKSAMVLEKNSSFLQLQPFPDGEVDVGKLLQATFLNLTDYHGSSGNESGHESSKLNFTGETVLLTGLAVAGLWETPFHPRYSKRTKFFLNSTHVEKTRIMNNIGFYKYCNWTELNATAIAAKLKNSNSYMTFVKPNNPDDIELLNTNFENLENFPDVFRKCFKTKRVQVALPRVDVDSQFPIDLSESVSTLHVTSLKISYTGLYNNFQPTVQQRRLNFHRLKRRPDDEKFNLNCPFIYHLYDDTFAGFLMSGIIMNPSDGHEQLAMASVIPAETQLQNQLKNHECLQGFNELRKNSSIYDNLQFNCSNTTENATYAFQFFTEKKPKTDKFYKNEIDFGTVPYLESVARIRYTTLELMDGKFLQFHNGTSTLSILTPSERSGISKVEDFLENFDRSKCQLKGMTVRAKLPIFVNNNFSIAPGKSEEEMIEAERRERARRKHRRYRKISISHSFIYIVEIDGAIQQVGRVVTL